MKNVKLKVKDGEFIRTDSNFRNWITKDGSPGISGIGLLLIILTILIGVLWPNKNNNPTIVAMA